MPYPLSLHPTRSKNKTQYSQHENTAFGGVVTPRDDDRQMYRMMCDGGSVSVPGQLVVVVDCEMRIDIPGVRRSHPTWILIVVVVDTLRHSSSLALTLRLLLTVQAGQHTPTPLSLPLRSLLSKTSDTKPNHSSGKKYNMN